MSFRGLGTRLWRMRQDYGEHEDIPLVHRLAVLAVPLQRVLWLTFRQITV
jgi:hypothetical protein